MANKKNDFYWNNYISAADTACCAADYLLKCLREFDPEVEFGDHFGPFQHILQVSDGVIVRVVQCIDHDLFLKDQSLPLQFRLELEDHFGIRNV